MSEHEHNATASPENGPKTEAPRRARLLAVGEICQPGDFRRGGGHARLQLTAEKVGAPVQAEWGPIYRDAEPSARPIFDPTPRRCPHCGHVGVPDQECSHETCVNCGMALDEAPAGQPGDDGKISAEELRQMSEAEGEPVGHVGGSFVTDGGKIVWAPAGGPIQRIEIQRADGQPIGPPGTDMRALSIGETMRVEDRLSDGERIPSEWVGLPCKADGIFRGVPLGERPGEEGPAGHEICPTCGVEIIGGGCRCGIRGSVGPGPHPAGVPGVASKPPAWFAGALLEARCRDLANAGKRLAKCSICSGLLYETEGVFVHADGLMPSHVGAPVEIFDPAAAEPEPGTFQTFCPHCHAQVDDVPAKSLGFICPACKKPFTPPFYDPEMDTCAMAAPVVWLSNWEKLMRWIFPPAPTLLIPEAPAEWVDVIHLYSVTHFSFIDRLRILVSGRVYSKALIVCQNLVGETKSVSMSRPLAPWEGRE